MDVGFQILSLSGGGARGLYTAQVLAELEECFGTSIAKHFDIICGTSIGGILALGIAAGIPAAKILKVFDTHRQKIFPPVSKNDCKPCWWRFGLSAKDFRQIKAAQYNPGPLRNVLEDLFDDRKMADLQRPVVIPAINYTVGRVRAFKTPHESSYYQDAKRSLIDVALATSAAPTYFPLHQVEGGRYVDGGLAANNPILMGVIEAYNAFDISLDMIRGLCIGNMGQGLAADHDKPVELGYMGWGFGRDIIDLAMSTGEQLSYDMARMLLNDRLEMIDTPATKEQAHMLRLDNASDSVAEILKVHARQATGAKVNDVSIRAFFSHTASAKPTVKHLSSE